MGHPAGAYEGAAGGGVVGGFTGGSVGYAAGFYFCAQGTGPNQGGQGSATGTLSDAARRKLGNLANRAGEKVRDVIRSRGGTASNVNQAGPWADRTLGETADAAVKGDQGAETAIKIAKQAGRLGQKY